MSRPNFFIVAGNTAPAYEITCTRAGTDIDLTTASSVDIILYDKTSKVQTNTGHTTTPITTPISGLISYTAETGDFPSKGTYVADIKVTWSGGGTEVLYNQATWKVRNTGVS